MKKLMLTCAAAALISTGAMAQFPRSSPPPAQAILPPCRSSRNTARRSAPTRPNKVRPVETREKIVVGHPVPRQVSSRLCLTSGPSLTKCGKFYFGERVMLVDPSTRMVVQEID